jgi:hypothetical protein
MIVNSFFVRSSVERVTKRGARLLFFLIIVWSLCSCAPLLSKVQFTTSEPNKESFYGTWQPDEASLADMKVRGKYNVTRLPDIVLSADNTYQATGMPDWLRVSLGDSEGTFYSESGNWRIVQDGQFWMLELKSAGGFSRLNIVEQQPPYRLYTTLGDPDSGNSMTFVKNR